MQAQSADRYDLVYIDPPFNTGKRQRARRTKVSRDEDSVRVGFGGQRYRTEVLSERSYADQFLDYEAFLAPRLAEAARLLKPEGSLFVHLDPREVHYVKVMLDGLFGRDCFQNELIWAYDFGGRSKIRWAAKHDNILWYTMDPKRYHFDREGVERIPYMAPGLVTKEKAKRGKLPTDVWWNTIVSPTGKERLGYPSQKPLAILERIVEAHCPPEGLALDFFAGSGTLGAAALRRGRRAVLVDETREGIEVMKGRLDGCYGVFER
ncbi:MAG: site-specific DNA-methyltransferase [Planctomycetota bacterium]|nr:site-specific DNA-methyltransferase [Planctomycetota bacterium]